MCIRDSRNTEDSRHAGSDYGRYAGNGYSIGGYMEYVQMTLDDWVQMKQKLRQELIGVKQSFVRIGYALRQIDDQRLYENDGYKSIAEFAKMCIRDRIVAPESAFT